MRFTRALNPLLMVIAISRRQLRALVDAIRAAAAKGSGCKTYRLTDFEFVVSHKTLHIAVSLHPLSQRCAAALVLGFVNNPTTEGLVARLEYALFRG